MKLRKFTDLAGHAVWINGECVVMVRRPVRGLDSDTAGCVLDLSSGETQAITEDVETAVDLLTDPLAGVEKKTAPKGAV